MKDLINSLQEKIQGLDNLEAKDQLTGIVARLLPEYQQLESKVKLVTKESIGRKQKLNELYEKVDTMSKLQLQLEVVRQQNEKLNKYHEAAVNQKKIYNERIKTYFDTKLSNEMNKDYHTFKNLYSQFNFNAEDETVYDRNKQKYELLQLTGVFGNEKLVDTKQLPKPHQKKPSTGRWGNK